MKLDLALCLSKYVLVCLYLWVIFLRLFVNELYLTGLKKVSAMLFVFHLFYKIAVSYTVNCVSEASNRIIYSPI